nr:MFS transporter [Burkholderia sp. Cy-637]
MVSAPIASQGHGQTPCPQADHAAALEDRTVGRLAAACAVAVANAYYIQPLLVEVGRALSIAPGMVGILPGLSQVGLALGLAFLLPLGDMVPARRLLLTIVPLQIAALILFAASGSGPAIAAASLLIGLFGITPYVLPPYVSLRVPPSRLGHVTARLTRGVVIGILLARTASGMIGTQFGWRAVYGLAALGMTLLLIFLSRVLEHEPGLAGRGEQRYRDLMASLPRLLRTLPELRIAALCQALGFGSFNVFWLGATLYLQGPGFGWTPRAVGLVALVGAAAAGVAPWFGRAIDRSGPHRMRRLALAGMALSWLLLVLLRGHLAWMAPALIALDISATLVDISNRTILYGLDANFRTRLNAIYQIAMFCGGATMSVLVGFCWSLGGWPAVCALGAIPVAIAWLGCGRGRR